MDLEDIDARCIDQQIQSVVFSKIGRGHLGVYDSDARSV